MTLDEVTESTEIAEIDHQTDNGVSRVMKDISLLTLLTLW
jgi:hypothetical protein